MATDDRLFSSYDGGDSFERAGGFLFTQQSFVEESSIYHFSADDVGAGTTTGTVSTLISSVDIDVNWNNFLGVMLISEDLYLDGAMVPAGSSSLVTTGLRRKFPSWSPARAAEAGSKSDNRWATRLKRY